MFNAACTAAATLISAAAAAPHLQPRLLSQQLLCDQVANATAAARMHQAAQRLLLLF
jgi:hypothetical protein